jgi:protein-tyrosine-phosphatase/predicted ATP-grasp superfamily ATP-dependent carboligase
MGGRVLVLGDDTRSFLAILRSLGRRGIEVHVAPANFRSAALKSRYISAVHDLPPWLGKGSEWLRAMEALLRETKFDLVIPCDETTLLPLQRSRAKLDRLTMLAIPDDDAIDLLFDKHATRKLAQEVGIPVAVGRLMRPHDSAEAIFSELGAPIVIKPRRSFSPDNLGIRNRVQVVGDPARLDEILCHVDSDGTLLEKYFDGRGIGISLLASDGCVLQAFAHHRVHETAGASFYRVSAPLSRDLMKACEAIIAAAHYTGVAMLEFKHNAKGESILLEVNARPWGSLPLPVSLGVDFPYRWYRLLTTGEKFPAVTYRVGVYGRNLLPDIRASIAEAKAKGRKPVSLAGFVARRTAELLRPLIGREVHDVLVSDDLRPGVIELMEVGANIGRRCKEALPGVSVRRRMHALAQIRQGLRAGAPSPFLLFVCLGNICRSPFAEALLRIRLPHSPIAIASAGMIPQLGRRPPPLALEAAATHGIDLSAHRSVFLTRELLERASLVIVFDENTDSALFDRYPQLKVPVISLADVSGRAGIADPIDHDSVGFRWVYAEIATAIDKLTVLLLRVGR